MKYFMEVSFTDGKTVTFEVDNHPQSNYTPWECFKFGDTIIEINYSKVNYYRKYQITDEQYEENKKQIHELLKLRL